MDLSCAFPPSLKTPEYIKIAEGLGYARAWVYDSPAYYCDPWVILALAAERTDRIGLGIGVLVPSLRHLMVTASSIATLDAVAPQRFAITVGSGFSGRMGLGHRAMRWADVSDYVQALRGLLKGEIVNWDGRKVQMQHPEEFGSRRPIQIPILIAADGPKGFSVANALGDGAFFAPTPHVEEVSALKTKALLIFGTVLDDGEKSTSNRAKDAFGSQLAAAYHIVYERMGSDAVDALPGGLKWRDSTTQIPDELRHLAIHEGHLVAPNERDAVIVSDGAENAPNLMWIDQAGRLRDKVAELDDLGVTEVVFQPGGNDIDRELRAFATLVDN